MQRAAGSISAWALVVVASFASAFQPGAIFPSNDVFRGIVRSRWNDDRHTTTRREEPTIIRRTSIVRPSRVVLQAEEDHDDDEEREGNDAVDFFVSPVQIAYLRKEANKRESNRRLVKYNLPPQDVFTASHFDISPDAMRDISHLFDGSEIIEVRGISRDSRKGVFDAARALAGTLEDAFDKPVVVVDIRGHAAKLYSPWDEDDDDDDNTERRETIRTGTRIRLRSNYRPGQWTRKARPMRDNRGQIVTDEDGMSVKVIPED
jgi:hypothetical protein